MVKTNKIKAYEIPKIMLTTTGAWPMENPTITYQLWGTFNYLLCIALTITMLIEAFNNRNNLVKLSEILYVLISMVTYVIKHASFSIKNKKFIRMMLYLDDPIFQSYPDDFDGPMARSIRIARFISNTFRLMCVVVLCLWIISPLLDGRSLPFPFPYDLGKYRMLFYVFQSVCAALASFNNSCLDYLTTSLMGVLASQFEILEKKIVCLRDASYFLLSGNIQASTSNGTGNDEFVLRNLEQCIRHHLAIIQQVEAIEAIFSFGILVQFLGSIVVICNTLFHSVLVPLGSPQFFVLLVYFLIMILQLFVYCWFGNEIAWKSLSVAEACYIFDWYNCENTVRKYLLIIMERSKRPIVVTAFKFSPLSLRSFTSIMQWSYSYFALLMKLYSKRSDTN